MSSDIIVRNCSICSKFSSQKIYYESNDSRTSAFECRDAVFPTILLDSLNFFRKTQTLCDVTLVVGNGDVRISAHKAILAAVSPYFRAMFSGGLRESGEAQVTLYDFDSNIIQKILGFIYTAEIQITDSDVASLLVAADFFQISSLQNLCCQFLCQNINAANCIGIYLSAKARNCEELAHLAKRFALEHFRHLVVEEEFLQLPFLELKSILDSPLLNTSGEGELLQTVKRWVEANPSERLQYLSLLVSSIDVWQVPAEKLLDFVNSDILRQNLRDFTSYSEPMNTEAVANMLGGDLKLAVEKMMAQRCDSPGIKPQQPYPHFHGKKLRHSYEQEVIIALGGESGNLVLSSMECFTMGFDGWRCSIPTAVALSGIPEPTQVMPTMRVQRSFGAVASYDYGIFVVGGVSQGSSTSGCEHYSVPGNEWHPISPLPIATHGSAAAVSNQKLCVSGGRSENGPEKRVWVLDQHANTWESLPYMLNHRCHHGTASLNGLLYSAGGIGGSYPKNEDYLSSCECYDPSLQRWIPVSPMNEARAYFGLVSLGPHLYAVGGYNGVSWLRSMERYDPLTNQWTLLTPMSVARSAFGTTVCNGRIYVMGGSDGIHLLNTVEKFNPRTNRWHCAQAMQVRRLGLGSATVKIPLKME